jgi:nicotinate-nucleotide--dimethylbenzimidazole phosphoribosyltransferase
MYLGEGTGAVLLMPLLDMALRLYDSGQSFERLGIEAYRPQ